MGWWRPASCGYTTERTEAGAYERAEAQVIVDGSEGRNERIVELTADDNPRRASAKTDAAKHKPGPWNFVEADNGWVVGPKDAAGSDYVADAHMHVGRSQDDERDLANARLIAAAPELLEATERWLDEYADYTGMSRDEVCGCNGTPPLCTPCIARAAIAKARGGS